jgi:hypothetical protein
MNYAAEAKREVGSLRRRFPEKPPAGIRAELDAMAQEKANAKGMKAHEGRKLAKGGKAKGYAGGGSASSRADGCAQHGKTRGMMR